MAVDPAEVEAIARELAGAMQRDHGDDQELTAAVSIVTSRRPNGEHYIRFLAVDGDGLPLPPWHLKGILRDLLEEVPNQ